MLSSQQDPKSPYLNQDTLPGWLELDYRRRPRPLGACRKWVTVPVTAVCAAWAVWTCLPGRHAAHEAGPVSSAHASFNADCKSCHTEAFQTIHRLWAGDSVRSVPDRACVRCHDGPLHHEHARMLACAACHREHRGQPTLARVADGHCTGCHENLKAEYPHTRFGDVSDFPTRHPEFGPARPGAKDHSHIHFSHAGHLRLDLKALKAKGGAELAGLPDRLDCGSCHQPDAARRYMQPINYEKHCAQCHALRVQVAGEFPDESTRKAAVAFRATPAPHRPPGEVRAALRERYLRFVEDNPVVPAPPRPDPRPLPGRGPRPVTPGQWAWAKGQLGQAEKLLFLNRQQPEGERLLLGTSGGCLQCHDKIADPSPQTDGLPVYAGTDIPPRWFTHSVFRHDSHRDLRCVSCHGKAESSTQAGDVLMPGIESCRQCHNPRTGVRSTCTTCHNYHDHARERDFNGPLTIKEALGGK